MKRWGILMMVGSLLSACATEPRLEKVKWESLSGFQEDNIIEAAPAYTKSCEVMIKNNPREMLGYEGVPQDFSHWQKACQEFLRQPPQTSDEFRSFLKNHFDPYQVEDENDGIGLFTGYYEPFIRASQTQSAQYNTPIYLKPQDLVVIEDLGLFKSNMKGERIAGRLHEGTLAPYYTRAEIDAGALQKQNLEIAWAQDPIDLFFLHIQGSGRLQFEDGSTLGIGYHGTNGRAYFAIGKALYERGHLPKGEINLDSIKAWLRTHPDEGQEIMHMNPSYVFFRIRDTEDPVGSQGVELTPQRSMAIDRKYVELGNLLWLDCEHPLESEPIRQLMVTQDTGGAIKGTVRGDFYWGSGEVAEKLAGPMKSKGRFFVLVPKK